MVSARWIMLVGRFILVLDRRDRAIRRNATCRKSKLRRRQVSMPSASTSTLSSPSAFEIVLLPFDDGAVLHRRVLDRHDLVEPAARDDEAADMLGEMARSADQLLRQLHHLLAAADRTDRARRGAPPSSDTPLRRPAPQRAGKRSDRVLRQAEHLADFADGAAAAIADHRRGQAGALAAIFFVDVLDHLLAPLMLEIDVDVGRLAALGGDEALEQQIDLVRAIRR